MRRRQYKRQVNLDPRITVNFFIIAPSSALRPDLYIPIADLIFPTIIHVRRV